MQVEPNREINSLLSTGRQMFAHLRESSASAHKIGGQTPQPPIAHFVHLYCLGMMVWNTRLFSLCQLSWLCPVSATSHIQPVPVCAEQRKESPDIKSPAVAKYWPTINTGSATNAKYSTIPATTKKANFASSSQTDPVQTLKPKIWETKNLLQIKTA